MSSSKKHRHVKKSKSSRYIRYGWPAFVLGVILTAVILPRLHGGNGGFVTYDSPLDVDKTLQSIKRTVGGSGWKVTGTIHLNNVLAEEGVQLERQIRILKVHNTEFTEECAYKDVEALADFPWSILIYEGEEGKARVAHRADMKTGVGTTLGVN
ncbi:MAG: hypothetical protein JXR94_08940 [Candidatus Hydrogenedentes bacterium]|nr:hypothetical protein [Candidatus Hydrogenedentota bacterium]